MRMVFLHRQDVLQAAKLGNIALYLDKYGQLLFLPTSSENILFSEEVGFSAALPPVYKNPEKRTTAKAQQHIDYWYCEQLIQALNGQPHEFLPGDWNPKIGSLMPETCFLWEEDVDLQYASEVLAFIEQENTAVRILQRLHGRNRRKMLRTYIRKVKVRQDGRKGPVVMLESEVFRALCREFEAVRTQTP